MRGFMFRELYPDPPVVVRPDGTETTGRSIQFIDPVETERVAQIVDSLDAPIAGVTWDDLYDYSMRAQSDILGLMSKYEDLTAETSHTVKIDRAQLDTKLSGSVNEATHKPYTRDAIEAVITCDDQVQDHEEYARLLQAIVRYLKYVNLLLIQRHERIIAAQIDARRANQQQQC
jgi:hypothetical protein